jgi:hypothetical protein
MHSLTEEQFIPFEKRIIELLEHLGLQQAHFLASGDLQMVRLLGERPECLASLTVVTPGAIPVELGKLGATSS